MKEAMEKMQTCPICGRKTPGSKTEIGSLPICSECMAKLEENKKEREGLEKFCQNCKCKKFYDKHILEEEE